MPQGVKDAMGFFDPLVNLHVSSTSGMKNRANNGDVMYDFDGAGLALFVQDGGFLQGFKSGNEREVGMAMVALRGLA